MIDEYLEFESALITTKLDSNGPSKVPTDPACAGSASNTDGICPNDDPHTEEVEPPYCRVAVYKDGAYCPVTWDPVEGRWLKGPITVFRDEDQLDGASGGEDPMLREAAE